MESELQAICAQRRRACIQQIGKNAAALVFAATPRLRAGDAHYPFRQDSDFYYLTGFEEPYAVALLLPGRAEGEFVLFNQASDPAAERWEGKRLGQAAACTELGADQAYSIEASEVLLPDLLLGREILYYAFGHSVACDQQVMQWLKVLKAKQRRGRALPMQLRDLGTVVHELRLIKSSLEIQTMRRAAEISAQAHIVAMQACRVGSYEYELAATFTYHCLKQGCNDMAYPSIVAAGENACILHYVTNKSQIRDGDLVLIDAAGEYDNYAADITRTFPANGKFSGEQRAVYEVVLAAQQAAIAAIKPGVTWESIQSLVVKKLTEGLVALGLLQGVIDDLIEQKAYSAFYMHSFGHWLGLNVHDVGAYQTAQGSRALEAGMVLTVEPGLYMSADTGVDAGWQGIGIRIEDDVVVTEQGCEVLSAAAPKAIDDIEACMRGA